ncbi:MAG: DUF2088 domain-containing protein [Planctomycetota bacterium]|nr:MAG: DUF2088 domain-containing protein [Planctomycetota bacterium]REJ97464.1 MAG: DUF2088 domain-containing protein [Planctomycetota bacterium]REK20984.1 MAG: DUF2088 domain-containing protein [Planctomycetota bacterium]REK37234.1 MAG: DUF2088 domain-containing protein [Planctomycetota bacterium]
MRGWPITYGASGRFSCDVDDARLVGVHAPPPEVADIRSRVADALKKPLEFPPLAQCVFPDDRIAIVVDRHTPCAPEILAEVWSVLAQRGVSPSDVIVLQPAHFLGMTPPDPRGLLPDEVSRLVSRQIHDPTVKGGCRYLAATASGERVYLSKELVDADMMISIGPIQFDSLLGYRGTHSAIYPGLSTTEAMRKAHGQGHDELTADDPRPLRQMVDEIAWLLGAQFSIQVIPACGAGAAAVIAGQAESVLRRGKQVLSDCWKFELSSRPELVVAGIDADAAGHDWDQLAAALDTARRMVVRDGRVVVLTELATDPGDGVRMIRETRSPHEALKPLRKAAPPDLLAATQIAKALEWMNVYLLSRLDPQLVEDLFMIPLAGPDEAARVVEGNEPCAIVSGAHHASVRLVNGVHS